MSTLGPGGADWEDIYTGDGTDTAPFDHQLLADALALTPGAALDLGCGGGGNVIGLAQRGWIATGVDSSPKAISSARISAENAHVEARFQTADIITWKPDATYDLVINLFALPPKGPARAAVLNLAKGSLAPGGLLIVGEWESTDAHPGDYVTVTELTVALSDLEIIRSESINADPDSNNPEQPRSWSAVMVSARRP